MSNEKESREDGAAGQEAAGDEPSSGKKKPFYKRPRPVGAILCIGVLVVLAIGWYWLVSQQYVSTKNAFLKGHLVRVAAQVSGPIDKKLVAENARVEQGQLLLQLDPADFQVALAQAETRLASAQAKLNQAQARLSATKTGIDRAAAQVTVAKARAENAKSDYQRLKNVDTRAVSKQKVESAEHKMQQTRATEQAARQKVKSAKAQVKASKAGVAVAKAAIDQAQAGVEKAQLQLSYTRITAPVSGQVAELGVEAGEYVQAGQTLLTVVPPTVWVKANFKETEITHMRVGQSAKIKIDAFSGHAFDGHVASIQHATGAEFAVLPAQNATGNFIKIVQRVPVKIVFDEPPDLYVPAPGLSVVPTVKVLKHPPWPW